MLMVIIFKVDNMRKIVENSIMRCLVFGLMICICLQASGQDSLKCKKYIYVGESTSEHVPTFPGEAALGTDFDLISTPQMAFEYAEMVLKSVYGEKQVAFEYPFSIELVNKCWWYISGSLPKGYLGGVAYITISKRNGQIVTLYHEK